MPLIQLGGSQLSSCRAALLQAVSRVSSNMKTLVFLFSLVFATRLANAIDLQPIVHRVIADNRTCVRDATDRRYCVWTDDAGKANDLLRSFDIQNEGVALKTGEVLAVFFNDRIEEDLVQITYNKTARQVFADYADSGIRFKLKAPENGKKYSHATSVVFTVGEMPGQIGIRGMITDGVSEKK